ncbi:MULTISPECIES: hypothetical protein [Pseudomonas]|jgi:hypothetical protein|uniref:hypothetical protein n=1 Tax=Pseudomonas TaxID=286 RepID=UPI001F416FFB|nr:MULTISPECIES: hypothetical protein [Pseudomonas]UST88338.1 hypothetical protein NF678_16025 [Pseudomonas siliginis]UST93579.1 hypothetical protein NF679_16395 [Pseudomonas siliginis]
MADIAQKVIAVKFENHLSNGDPRTMKRNIISELSDDSGTLTEQRQSEITEEKPPVKRIGLMKGRYKTSDDFDAPLPDALLDSFES